MLISENPGTGAKIRRYIIVLYILGVTGTGTELLLMEHTEELQQYIPLVLIGISLAILVWHWAVQGAESLRIFSGTMFLFILSGFTGLYFHYIANMEFKQELNPAMGGFDLFWQSLQGTTPPSLAPGAMILFGLLGLVYTYRHPVLNGSDSK